MASTGEVIDQLTAARRHLSDAVRAATTALGLVDELYEQLVGWGVHGAAERMMPVRAAIEELLEWFTVSAVLLDEAITLAHRARGDPAGNPPAVAAKPRPHPDRASPPSTGPPAVVAEIGRKLPTRTGRVSPTTGEFNGERITSAEDDASVADLQPFPGGGWPSAIISHVESHVAARMRRQNLAEGTVVLNNITCGNRGFDNDWPATCEVYLRSILPHDARLTVWASQDGGRTWWTKTYVGTGERIR